MTSERRLPDLTPDPPGFGAAGAAAVGALADDGRVPAPTVEVPLAAGGPDGPYAGGELLRFLAARAVPGVEVVAGGAYRRSLRLPGGAGVLAATPGPPPRLHLTLEDPRDRPAAERLARRLLDLDADARAIDAHLGADPLLAPLVARRPGLRVPGHVDGFELAVRAVLGQQVSVKGAVTLAARLVARLGRPLPAALAGEGLTHRFPTAVAVAGGDLEGLGVPGARVRALRALAAAVAGGALVLEPGTPTEAAGARRALLALPGIGPWTAGYVAMRALGDGDAFPAGDLGLRRALAALAGPGASLDGHAERWRPWRAYAAMHLWAHLAELPAA